MPWLLSTSWFSRTRLLGAGRLRLVAPFFGPLPALNFAFAETLLLLAARFLPLFLFFFFIFALRNRAAQSEGIRTRFEPPRLTSLYALFPNRQTPRSTDSLPNPAAPP